MVTPLPGRLKAARLSRGLSQKSLGLAIGLDPSVASTRMNQYERAKHQPDFSTIKRLAETLDLPVSWFYAEDDEEARWIQAWHRLDLKGRQAWLEKLTLVSAPRAAP